MPWSGSPSIRRSGASRSGTRAYGCTSRTSTSGSTSRRPGGPQQSQRWHRDVPEDHDIVKCFVYLDDVPLGAGPLQYIAGSNTPAGRRRRMRTEFDRGGYRLSDEAIADSFNENDIVVSQGPAGTVVFADTRGIHRGGHAIDRDRFVLQITYASAASVKRRTLRAAPGVDRSQLAGVRLVD